MAKRQVSEKPMGKTLAQVREDLATLLSVRDEWHELRSRGQALIKQAIANDPAAFPKTWGRRITQGAMVLTAANVEDQYLKNELLDLGRQLRDYNNKFERKLRALIAAGECSLEASPHDPLAPRSSIHPDTWEYLIIRDWETNRIAALNANGLPGQVHSAGHLYAARFNLRSIQLPARKPGRRGRTFVVDWLRDKYPIGVPPENRARIANDLILAYRAAKKKDASIDDVQTPLKVKKALEYVDNHNKRLR